MIEKEVKGHEGWMKKMFFIHLILKFLVLFFNLRGLKLVICSSEILCVDVCLEYFLFSAQILCFSPLCQMSSSAEVKKV